MNKLTLTILLALFSFNALASEKKSWDGSYASLLIGYTHGNVNEKNGLSDYYVTNPDGYDYLVYGGGKTSFQSISGSIKLGYNITIPNSYLIGLELGTTFQDASSKQRMIDAYKDLNTEVINNTDDQEAPLNVKTKINNYQTLGLRVGHILNEDMLFYVMGGGTFGKIERNLTQTGDSANWFLLGHSITERKNETGYVLGLGIEHKLNNKFSVKASYEYVNFGNIKMTYRGPTHSGQNDLIEQSHKLDFSNFAIGLAYQF